MMWPFAFTHLRGRESEFLSTPHFSLTSGKVFFTVTGSSCHFGAWFRSTLAVDSQRGLMASELGTRSFKGFFSFSLQNRPLKRHRFPISRVRLEAARLPGQRRPA